MDADAEGERSPQEATDPLEDARSFIASLPDVRTAARHLGVLRLSQARLLEAFRTSVSAVASTERQMRHGDALAAQLAKARAENDRLVDRLAALSSQLSVATQQREAKQASPTIRDMKARAMKDAETQSAFAHEVGAGLIQPEDKSSITIGLDMRGASDECSAQELPRMPETSTVLDVADQGQVERIVSLDAESTKSPRELGVVPAEQLAINDDTTFLQVWPPSLESCCCYWCCCCCGRSSTTHNSRPNLRFFVRNCTYSSLGQGLRQRACAWT
jgi:hypothetical protein